MFHCAGNIYFYVRRPNFYKIQRGDKYSTIGSRCYQKTSSRNRNLYGYV